MGPLCDDPMTWVVEVSANLLYERGALGTPLGGQSDLPPPGLVLGGLPDPPSPVLAMDPSFKMFVLSEIRDQASYFRPGWQYATSTYDTAAACPCLAMMYKHLLCCNDT